MSAVTAVAYNNEGDKLASFSLADGRILLWTTKTSFFEYFSAAPSYQRVADGIKADGTWSLSSHSFLILLC
jgi:hypothetical protein